MTRGCILSAIWLLLVPLCGRVGAETTGDDPDGAGGADTVITSRTMTFAYGAGTARFTGDVDLTDPEVRLQSDTLLVIFDEEGDVERVEAEGNVRIWQGDRRGTCEAAIYTARDGMIRMLGGTDPDRPRPARLMSGTDALAGDEIRIYLHLEKIVCKPGKLVIFPGEDAESTGLNRLRLRPLER